MDPTPLPNASGAPTAPTGQPDTGGGRRRGRLPSLPIVYQLSLVITVLVVVCMTLLGVVLIYHQNQVLGRQIEDLGRTMAAHVARSATEPLLADDHLALEVLATNLNGGSVLGTAILAANGKVIATAGVTPFAGGAPLAGHHDALAGLSARGLSWQAPGGPGGVEQGVMSFASPIRFQKVVAGYAVLTFSRAALDESRRDAVHTIAVATLLMILVGMVLAYMLSRRLSRPIHELVDVSRALDEGRFRRPPRERRNDEIGHLMAAFDRLADGMLQKAQVEAALDRYLSPNIARQVLSNLESVHLGGRHVQASVLFADIVGFTRLSTTMPAEDVARLLNRYFAHISDACTRNGGLVDKYMGDCAMMVFGVPDTDDDHCFHAIACALAIQRIVARENVARVARGETPVEFRIGLNTGSMLAGTMGSRQRMEYTVVGDAVNLASRLCSAAEAGQIIISEELYQRPEIRDRVVARCHASIRLRGIPHPVTTYLIEDLAEPHRDTIERQVDAVLALAS